MTQEEFNALGITEVIDLVKVIVNFENKEMKQIKYAGNIYIVGNIEPKISIGLGRHLFVLSLELKFVESIEIIKKDFWT